MSQTHFKVGDKVIILPSFFTKLFDIAGKKATVVWVNNGNSEQLEQVRVEVPNKGKFYLLLSEIEKIGGGIYEEVYYRY